MEPERRCPECGRMIPWGERVCPVCSQQGGFLWSLERDTFLLLTFLGLIILFAATAFAAKFYHAKQKALAQEWYSRGERELGRGRPDAALTDFRTALAYARENRLYELRLAQALVAAGRVEEGRAYLLGLWEREPGGGTVNLELARLAVRTHSVPEALRYFHNAIYGEWEGDAAKQRRDARLELAGFLLDGGQKAQAQSELIALAADLPRDPELQTQVGELLRKAGEDNQALKLFRQALTLDARLETALADAGEASFDLNDFSQAQRYLNRALAVNPHQPQMKALLETTQMVLGIDPFRRGLGNDERARRALSAFEQAMRRLRDCAASQGVELDTSGGQSSPRSVGTGPPGGAPGAALQGSPRRPQSFGPAEAGSLHLSTHRDELQKVYAQAQELKPRLHARGLSRDSELLMTAMDLVFEVETITERECGKPQGLDLALLLVARSQGVWRP